METRAEQKARTRKKLVEAALTLSAYKGFSALSLREVAQAAELAPTAFYRHFADMEELGLSLVDEIAVGLRRLLRNSRRDAAGTDRSKLTAFSIKTFIDFVNDNAHLFRLLLGERQGSSDSFRRAIRKEMDLFISELAEDLVRLAKLRNEKLRNPTFAAEAIVTIIFTVGAEILETPRTQQVKLKNRLVEEVNMVLRGARIK